MTTSFCVYLLAACSTAPQSATPPQACHLDRVADLPMASNSPYAIIPARIDGQTVSMLLDTGDERLTIRQQVQGALRLPSDPLHRTTVHGIGGSNTLNDVIIQRFELGGTELPQTGAALVDMPAPVIVNPPLAGIIGGQILSGFDVEMNFAARRVALWQRSDCDSITPAWTGAYASAVLARSSGNLVTLSVLINGHNLRALLDTGARTTTISATAATQLGLTVLANRTSVSRGADGNDVFAHITRLREIVVGAAHKTDMTVLVAPITMPFADMMLGVDYWQHHRIWISYAGQRVFIQ